jgi:hypothetical protein
MGEDTGCVEDASGLLRRVWREQIGKGTVQPTTELFEQVQTNILLAHLDPMQRRFRNPQLPRKVPMRGIPASPSYFACQLLPQLSHIRDL